MIKELFFQIILCWLEVEQKFLENPCFNFKQVFQSTSCYTQKPLFILHTSLKNIYFCTTICYNTRNLADKNLWDIFGDFATDIIGIEKLIFNSRARVQYPWPSWIYILIQHVKVLHTNRKIVYFYIRYQGHKYMNKK